MIDTSLLEHWCRERAARERIRRALPASYRGDQRPRIADVREAYVEAMLAMKTSDDAFVKKLRTRF